jgi:uncharacterized protein YlxP (DUF503 family)
MVIGVLQLSIRLPEAQSLKEKRWILKSLVTRIRNKFNVSISEIGAQDTWQRAELAIAHVGSDQPRMNQILDQVLNFAEGVRQLEVVDSKLEFL